MRLTRNIRLAFKTMRANRGRSALTMLGVIIAVASVTIVFSIGGGIKSALLRQAAQYEQNVITVRPAQIGTNTNALSRLSSPTVSTALTVQDANDIAGIPQVRNSLPLTIVGAGAEADHRYDGIVFATSNELSRVINQDLDVGAFFTSRDNNSNLAVLGATAADRLFDQKVPLGRSFTIRGQQFIVSGVLSKFATTPFTSDVNFNDAIFVPNAAITTLTPGGAPIYEILAKVDDDTRHLGPTSQAIRKVLTQNHKSNDDFTVRTPDQLATDSTAGFDVLTQLVLVAAIITLLVSGIGIMNVMLVSVTERIHEIGIRKAVGATNRQILSQFLTEAATLCVVGSIIGVIVAFVVVFMFRTFSTNVMPIYDWRMAGLACAVACGCGIVFGTLPAVKAARKDPINALRQSGN